MVVSQAHNWFCFYMCSIGKQWLYSKRKCTMNEENKSEQFEAKIDLGGSKFKAYDVTETEYYE